MIENKKENWLKSKKDSFFKFFKNKTKPNEKTLKKEALISDDKKKNWISKDSKFNIIKENKNGPYIVSVKNLNKTYGNQKVIDNISFKIKRGEVLGLIGGNGAGKTTLSEIIAGIVKPTNGTVKYSIDFKDNFKEKIGMQFQTFEYPSGLSVKDIITFARNLRKLKITNQKLKIMLQEFQMDGFYKKKVNSLSGGQKQKLNIFLSIIHNPDLLILDELSTGLDVVARESIIAFTKKIISINKSSCIIITHNMSEIEAICDSVMVLSEGKIVDNKEVSQIKKEYKSINEYMRKMILENTSEGKVI